VTDGAKLCSPIGPAALVGALLVAMPGCADAPRERVAGVYARDSRVLLRIDYDSDADGRIDTRTYMRNARAVRVEADLDGDDRIDRWEYYGASGDLLRIGGSTQADGREDTWVRVDGSRRTLDISTARDGRIDRRETYDGDTLVRAEADTDLDGRPDRWEEFRNGALARVLIDEERRHGRPTRRIVYGAGEDARIETDPDGDGVWDSNARR
jgi:hypothetical protein